MDILGSEFKPEDLKGVTWIVVKAELKKKPGTYVTGLLYGYRPLTAVNTQIVSQDEMFLWLVKGDDVHILNKFHYSIISIEVGKAVSSTKYSAKDDEISYKRIQAIVDALKEEGKTEPSGLIDLTKYGDLPKNLESEIKKPTMLASQSSSSSADHNRSGAQNYGPKDWSDYHTNQSRHNSHACGYTPAKKQTSTTVIKRTTKYPISNAIDKMRAKVELLRQGKYEPPKLRDVEKEEESQKKAKSK
jgi:hypothetical protein